MSSEVPQQIHFNRWFYFFVSVHVFFWAFLPALIRHVLPMDALEGAIWGQHLALGYDKNPFMNAWLTRLAVTLGGQSGWMVYLFGQLFVALCFFCVWKLAKKIVSPVHALISVFLLEFITTYNVDAIDFGDNAIQIGLWPLIILFFYNAVKQQRFRDWIGVGVFAGLAMMTKYYVVVLLLPMFLFLLMSRENRLSFVKPGLYIGLIIGLAIVTPHFIWLFSHHFVTIQYAFHRVGSSFSWFQHIIFPLKFTVPLLEACIPPLLIFLVLFIERKKKEVVISEQKELSQYQWYFLLLMGLGPFLITVVLSLLTGVKLHPGWSAPLLSLWGVILVAKTQPIITRARFYCFVSVLFVIMVIGFFAYTYSMLHAKDRSSANYPGREIAASIEKQWHEQYHARLSYVVGPRWEAGNVSFYSKDHPSVYMSGDPVISFWIDEDDLRQKGAVFIWDARKESFPAHLVQRFPRLNRFQIKEVYWNRSKETVPVKIGIAFLPPLDFQ